MAHTAREMSQEFIGKKGTVSIYNRGETIRFPVECEDARTVFNRIDVRLKAVGPGASGEIWLASSSVVWEKP